MKRLLTILTSFLLTFTLLAQQRPKVALVLSGGGAKGVAHVGAIRVIEEAGIPIDYIVGTSMGSIVGALYASGYTVEQMDSIINDQNWMNLLTDKVDRQDKLLRKKQRTDKFIISVDFEKSPFEVIEGGLLKGNNIAYLFSELTADHLQPMKYDDLPIPFACVAADILTGKEVVMRDGILAESMRTSMAIPGVFAPVKRDSMVLVDGGLVNNYPVDVAREMGADIVIGVSVSGEGSGYDNINSTLDVLSEVFGVVCSNKVEKNIADTDIFIHVDVKGYSAASFNNDALKTLVTRGETAARLKLPELKALHDSLSVIEPLPAIHRTPKQIDIDDQDIVPPSTIYNVRRKNSFLGVGARFDNEELASILLGGLYEFNHDNHFRVGLEARLGKRIDAGVYSAMDLGKYWNMELRYRVTHNDMRLYNEGEHIANVEYTKHRGLIDFSRSGKKFKINIGAQYSFIHYPTLLTANNWADLNQVAVNEHSLFYYIQLQFDNQNSRLLPTRGMKWSVKYDYSTDNGYGFNGGAGCNIVEGYWHMAIPLSRTTFLNPSVEGRFIQNNNTYISHCNFIGGINSYGHYITQQVSFAGINYVQIAPNSLLVGGVNLRQHLTENNYLFLQGNYGIAGSSLERFVTQKHLVGAAFGYGYKSPVGPLEFNLNWSNVTKKLGFYLNIGYMF